MLTRALVPVVVVVVIGCGPAELADLPVQHAEVRVVSAAPMAGSLPNTASRAASAPPAQGGAGYDPSERHTLNVEVVASPPSAVFLIARRGG